MDAMSTKIGRNPNQNQEHIISKQQISSYLSEFAKTYKSDELNTMQEYCQKMWGHEEKQGNLKTFVPKLLSLLKDMQKHVDLRVACFDLTTKGARDYSDIFLMFFQLQAAVLEMNESCYQSGSMQGPFSGDPDYELLRGSREHGVVVMYPQFHQVDDEMTNLVYEDRIFASQLSIYRDFLVKKPEHLYLEGTTPSSVKSWNEFDFAVNPIMSSVYHSIAKAIDNNQQLSERQKHIFLRDGGAGFYANLCKLTHTPVTKYPIEENGFEARASILKGKSAVEELTENERYLIYDSREEKLEKVITETANQRQGKPAYVVMGYVHTFDKVFQKEDSPAVYRRKFDLPGIVSRNNQNF